MTVSPRYRFHAQIRVSVFLSGNKGNNTVGPCRTMPAGAHAAQRFAQGCSTGSALESGSFAQVDHFTTQYDGEDHRSLPVPVIDYRKQQGALSCKGSQRQVVECSNVPLILVCLEKSTSFDDDGGLPVKYGGGVNVIVQAMIS